MLHRYSFLCLLGASCLRTSTDKLKDRYIRIEIQRLILREREYQLSKEGHTLLPKDRQLLQRLQTEAAQCLDELNQVIPQPPQP